MKSFYQHNTYGNKYNTEDDSHQDTNQQCPCIMVRTYIKEGKYQDEHKDVINAQTPLHQVGTNIFQSHFWTFDIPHKSKEAESQCYPEKCLIQGFFNADLCRFFTEQSQV